MSFLRVFGYGETERELSLKRKPSCGALDEILSDCEVSRGGGDIPTTCSYLSSSLFIVVNESSLLWRAKSSVGSSYGVLDVNTLISI